MTDPMTPERLAEAAKTLGKVIETQCRAALDATGLHDEIDETGDGDWGLVWERVAELGAEVRRLQAAAERVRALHHRVDVGVIVGDCAREECDHEGACPEVPFAVCDACYSIADQIDPYLYERGGVDVVKWPCPTIAALDGDEP